MTKPLPIAVIVPAWCSEAHLGEALDSVLGQTCLPQEILVVDDGSPGEGAREICEERGDPVQYLRKTNGGPASARNHGVRASRSEWLAFLDADDIWMPDKLALQWAAQEAHPGALLVCSEARLLGGARGGELRRDGQVPALDLPALLTANPIATSSVLLRRSAFEEAGGFCEDPALIAVEDYDLWLAVAALGPLLWIPRPLLEYRVHEASLSSAVRFHGGVNSVLDRAVQRHAPDPAARQAIRRHRATLDRNLAWELLEKGEVRTALRPIFHSLALTPLSWRSWKLVPKALGACFRKT